MLNGQFSDGLARTFAQLLCFDLIQDQEVQIGQHRLHGISLKRRGGIADGQSKITAHVGGLDLGVGFILHDQQISGNSLR